MQKGKANKTFGLIGLGFISTKHLSAIEAVGGELLAVCDNDLSKEAKCPSGAKFFSDFAQFVDFVMTMEIDYVAVCSPNHLHVDMVQELLKKTNAYIICEKPVGLSVEDLKKIDDQRVNCMHQLRYFPLPKIERKKREVIMDIHIRRDQWYFDGWKGDEKKSGGILFNIGIHYFDILFSLFGEPSGWQPKEIMARSARGVCFFQGGNVKVDWKITLNAPMDNQYRIIKGDDFIIDLTSGIDGLHLDAYKAILEGRGVKVVDILETYRLVYNLSEDVTAKREPRYQLQGKFHNIYGDPKIGDGTKIGSFVEIGPDVEIGKNCKIQAYVSIPAGITIADDVFIGPKTTFLNDKYPPSGEWSETFVGKGASIGGAAVILPGVRIGENAKVGAGAVVTKDIPAGETWVGNPAHKLN